MRRAPLRVLWSLLLAGSLGAAAPPIAAPAAVPASAPVLGREYMRLAHPLPVDPHEVVEVFWYDCPHSYQIQQPLDDWAARQSPSVHVLRIPASWSDHPVMVAYARLFYTLDSLGLAQREALAVFHAVRDAHQGLTTEDAVADWAAAQGVDAAKVRAAYESPEVQRETDAAPALRDRYQVDQEPTVVIGGTYRTSPFQTGSVEATVPVVDYLYHHAGNR